jgi:hypothetical protein
MLPGFGRLSEFRMVSFFRHPLIDRVVMYPDFLGDVPKASRIEPEIKRLTLLLASFFLADVLSP